MPNTLHMVEVLARDTHKKETNSKGDHSDEDRPQKHGQKKS